MTYDEYLKQFLIYKLKHEKNLKTISDELHIPTQKLLEYIEQFDIKIRVKDTNGRGKTKKT